MPKLLVETTGDFELVDFENDRAIVAHDRPSVVNQSTFISARTANGQIRVLDNLVDEATDEEFAKYVKDSDGDIELALSAFKTSYSTSSTSTTTKQPDVKRGKASKEQ